MAARNMVYEFRHSGSSLRVRALGPRLFYLHSILDLLSDVVFKFLWFTLLIALLAFV